MYFQPPTSFDISFLVMVAADILIVDLVILHKKLKIFFIGFLPFMYKQKRKFYQSVLCGSVVLCFGLIFLYEGNSLPNLNWLFTPTPQNGSVVLCFGLIFLYEGNSVPNPNWLFTPTPQNVDLYKLLYNVYDREIWIKSMTTRHYLIIYSTDRGSITDLMFGISKHYPLSNSLSRKSLVILSGKSNKWHIGLGGYRSILV